MDWDPSSSKLMLGMDDGEMEILKMQGVEQSSPVVTAWDRKASGRLLSRSNRHGYAIGCPLCRKWSRISASALGQEARCPHCESPLRLSGTVVEGDWRAVAKAWE